MQECIWADPVKKWGRGGLQTFWDTPPPLHHIFFTIPPPLHRIFFMVSLVEYRRARRKTNSVIAASSPHTKLRRVHQISAGSPQLQMLKILNKINSKSYFS